MILAIPCCQQWVAGCGGWSTTGLFIFQNWRILASGVVWPSKNGRRFFSCRPNTARNWTLFFSVFCRGIYNGYSDIVGIIITSEPLF